MKATEQLIQEHNDVQRMLKILGIATTKLENGATVNPLHLEAMLEFLITFVDKCHHGKEEKLLFPALINKGMAKDNGPVGVMLAEHVSGRNFIKGMSDAITAYRNGNTSVVHEIVDNARGYIVLLNQHIMKENNILFKMADNALSESEQNELFQEFEKLESNEIGNEVHQKYHNMLLELQEIYS
jgi:hemerythrin-like domain-containing protein